MSNRVAFIGLGTMGNPMAGHLLDAGHTLTVHTRTKKKAERLVNRGAKYAASPAEAVKNVDYVFLCVNDSPDVEKVALGEKGILSVAHKGLICVDHSTISPTLTRKISEEMEKQGIMWLDAPVSGGDIGAKNRTLSVMVGGNRRAYENVEPLLRTFGPVVTYCGPSGAGQTTKLVNQILVSVTNLAVSEALVFAKKHGLDLEKTIGALEGGAASSWQLSNLGPRMIAGDFRPGFSIKLQQKDLRLVLQAAEELNISLPAASLVHQLFSAAEASGHGRDGTQALYTVIEKLAAMH